MKLSYPALFVGLALCGSGCTTYRYRIIKPATGAPPVAEQQVTIHYEPFNYLLYRYRDRLAMHVTNPTTNRFALQGNRSYVVDPQGQSHPIRSRVLAPHSFTQFLFPPIPFTYAYPDYWAYGPGWWGPGWYGPGWYGLGWWGPGWWGPPPVSYAEVLTRYDWTWKQGLARIKLTYQGGGKAFEHDFEIMREPNKK